MQQEQTSQQAEPLTMRRKAEQDSLRLLRERDVCYFVYRILFKIIKE